MVPAYALEQLGENIAEVITETRPVLRKFFYGAVSTVIVTAAAIWLLRML